MKKILSIILAILMIVTTVPIAFAAEENVIDLSTLTGTYVISDSGEYTFTGSGNYGIKVESANPTIILNNASITVGEGSAIDIPSGSNTTIFVMGDNTIDTTNMWASVGGIFVAEGGTVNITSNSKANILRAHGSYSAAIGGKYDYPYESYNAGSICISNVTVYAYANNFHAAAIGAAGESTCGTINITNAVVYAYGAGDEWTSAPGIGSAWGHAGWPETIPVVIISDSEIHTFRYNSYSDYIGYLGDELGEEGGFHATGSINCGEGGSITNSTIYCYTGLDSTTTDKTVKYGTLGGLLKEDGTCESDCEGGSATCSVQAVCENCGTSYGEFDANKHTLVQKDAKAPTCTEIGWDAYEYCTACDYSTYVKLPAITHIDANCDYKCDYNCGYVYETLDFSDAKVLTTNEKGILCIDGVQVKYDTYTVTSTYFMYNQYLPSGKYKLSGDVTVHKNGFIYIKEGENVSVDLNGYTWNCNDCTYTDGTFSVYDTSKDEKGKITSPYYGQILIRGDGEFNLYSGTIENSKGGGVLRVVEGTANLYGGKLKSNEYIIEHLLYENAKINLGGTVLENEEGYPEIISFIASSEVPQGVINVADYTGESLTVEIDADYAGTIKILEGVENAQEAEKYTIKFYKNDFYYLDKTEYNEETGEMFAYTAKYAFTQQPSAENGYTVDFNNSDATFQWYEVEETILTPDNVTAIDEVIFENEKWLHGGWYVELFTVDVEAGDMITVSTTSARSFDLNVHTEDYSIEEYVKATGKASVTIDSDAEVIVGIDVDVPNETTEFEIELIRTSEMDETETDKTLQNPECGKTYVCKTSVGETVYLSDVVTVGHNIVSVDAKAHTCTEIGWDAYEYCTACDYTTYVELPVTGHIASPTYAPTTDGSQHVATYSCCGYESNENHSFETGTCTGCGASWFAVSGNTVTIDGTLGGKTTATEDDVNALVEKLKGYVDSGITTIIVTGSEPALHNLYDIDTPAVSAALYYLTDERSDSPYCGTIDLILPDVTEIVDDEFNNTFALNSITLPKVTKLGDLAFYACCFIQTIAFCSVVTDVEEGGGVMFHAVGEKVGGCDLILNCGQMNSSYIPDLDTNTWKFRYENEFKSITLTHTGGEATCIAKAVCETCGEEYGEFDANKHTLVQKDAKAPTCTEIGWDAYESCTECDYTTYEVLPASHNIVTVDAKAPTCTEIGWDAYEYCTECDYTTYEELPASHNIVTVDSKAPTCTEIGWDAYEYCTACTYTTYVEKEALKHSFTKYEVTEEAKCGVEGKEVAYCDHGCGETDEKAIEALTHSFTKYEVTEEAKCSVAGKEVAYCDNGCGETDEKEIEALKHLFVDYIYNEDATCEADGTKTAECIYGCGETDTVTAEYTMLDHSDEDGDGICDDCETEIKDLCPDCGGPAHEETGVPQYICMLITLIKLVVSLVKALQSVA